MGAHGLDQLLGAGAVAALQFGASSRRRSAGVQERLLSSARPP